LQEVQQVGRLSHTPPQPCLLHTSPSIVLSCSLSEKEKWGGRGRGRERGRGTATKKEREREGEQERQSGRESERESEIESKRVGERGKRERERERERKREKERRREGEKREREKEREKRCTDVEEEELVRLYERPCPNAPLCLFAVRVYTCIQMCPGVHTCIPLRRKRVCVTPTQIHTYTHIGENAHRNVKKGDRVIHEVPNSTRLSSWPQGDEAQGDEERE